MFVELCAVSNLQVVYEMPVIRGSCVLRCKKDLAERSACTQSKFSM